MLAFACNLKKQITRVRLEKKNMLSLVCLGDALVVIFPQINQTTWNPLVPFHIVQPSASQNLELAALPTGFPI